MANPVLRGFGKLATFGGRDTRGQFWPYAAVVLVVVFIPIVVGMAFSMNGFFAEMQQFAEAHPEAATVHSSPGSYSISIDASHPDAPMPDTNGAFLALSLGVLGAILLLAAAVSRRLHDSGRTGFWGLLPVPFLLFGIGFFPVMMNSMMTEAEPDFGLFFLLFGNNMLYLAALATLVILLSLSTSPKPNRHGDPPST